MKAFDLSKHLHSPDRLAALNAVALLDTPSELAFDRLSRLAARFLKAPIALVSLVDANRQFFKSCIGLPEPWQSNRETPLSHSFCQHNHVSGKPLLIEDARIHPLVKDNLAIVDLNVIAYLGIPLVTTDGYVLGSFCVIDNKPRNWCQDDIDIIKDLAAAVMTEIYLRTEIIARLEVEGDRDKYSELNILLREEIDNRKQAESTQLELEAQLHTAQKMEAIGRLSGGVAHDLNNLLTPILGYAELLTKDSELNSTQKEFLNIILDSGIRARDLVRQLLAFGRKQFMKFKPVNINTIIENICKLLNRTLPDDIVIKLNLSPIEPVMADISQIEQIIMNLTVNAVDAMPDGGVLSIKSEICTLDEKYFPDHLDFTAGTYIMMEFSDTGCGMAKETLDHVFEPFYSTKGEHGSGLGLATVFGIVKQHGGSIQVKSDIDKGAIFKIYLPVTKYPIAEESDAINKNDTVNGNETILIVEDNNQIRRLAEAILQQRGYRVLTESNGESALALLQSHVGEIHMLLTDVVMPGMNGRELCEKAVLQRPQLKVLYMSGYADNIIAQRISKNAATQLLQKPFSSTDLAEKVRAILDQ